MSPNRSGVSLVELLVVMAIIGILAAASLSVLGITGTSGRIAQTRNELQKLNSLFSARRNEFTDNLQGQAKTGALNATWLNIKTNALALTGTQPAAAKQALIALDRYRGTFPQREEDMYGLDETPGTADDSPLLSRWRAKNPTTKPDRRLESSELFMLAITVGGSQGAGKEIADRVSPLILVDKDGPDTNGDGIRDPNGVPEIYDGWGNPVRFYNAPTRLIRPGGQDTFPSPAQYALAQSLLSGIPPGPVDLVGARNFTQAFNQDPFDSKASLLTPPIPAPPTAVARNFDGTPSLEDRFHTPSTWYVPVLVSCGPDENLGLGEPTASGPARLGLVTDADAAADNVTTAQAGG